MVEQTDYDSNDALLLAGGEIETEDDRLIELLTRLGKTFGDRSKYEQCEDRLNV